MPDRPGQSAPHQFADSGGAKRGAAEGVNWPASGSSRRPQTLAGRERRRAAVHLITGLHAIRAWLERERRSAHGHPPAALSLRSEGPGIPNAFGKRTLQPALSPVDRNDCKQKLSKRKHVHRSANDPAWLPDSTVSNCHHLRSAGCPIKGCLRRSSTCRAPAATIDRQPPRTHAQAAPARF